MPATTRIARRSGIVSLGAMAAGAMALLSACTSSSSTAERSTDRTVTAPTPDLSPEAGTVVTTVRGPVADRSTGNGAQDDQDIGDVLLVGDSVLVLVVDDLAARMRATLHVDGADCRRLDQPVTGPCGGVPLGAEVDSGIDAVLAARAATRNVPDAAVLVLANNSNLTRAELDEAMAATPGIEHVWWVNTRIVAFGRQDHNNQLLAELAESDPRAGVVDWHSASEGEDWLADNVHPNEAGQAALAALIEDRLRCQCTA